MARTFHRRDRLSAISEINIMPLLDLAFALLIIFMITAPLLTQGISVELPRAGAEPLDSELMQDNEPLVLSINRRVNCF